MTFIIMQKYMKLITQIKLYEIFHTNTRCHTNNLNEINHTNKPYK